jgi:hypothetical protein
MKSYIAPIALTLFAALALPLPTAQAACGGGGYKAQPAQVSTAPMTQTNYQPSQPVYQNQTSSQFSSGAPMGSFDASYFHRISGRLHLNYEQSTRIIATLNDIRREMGEGKKIDPKQEFEGRLSQILDPQQFKEFQTLKSQA